MIVFPAFVWRGGFVRRALIAGGVLGVGVGVLAGLDSGSVVVGLIVFTVVGTVYGIWTARRMARYWPRSARISAQERVMVVGAVRRGARMVDGRLADAAAEYRDGLHAAARAARPLRWVIRLVLVVAVGTALWDAAYGSWGSAVASVLYLVALAVETLWWPRRRFVLLCNADRATCSSRDGNCRSS
ncbi:hypothetical protein ACTWP6_00670 [Mycobacterium sp. 4D054]|uniref:hypothetical protein n=1 Tax=Mycobacterium sp. 4D054 TaxID=3457440 RepID=UPI003FCFDC31